MANTTQKRVLPPWIIRLLGFSSIATLLVSIGLFLYKKNASTRSLPRSEDESNDRSAQQPSATRGNGWSLLNSKSGNKKKKKVTISLKNTVLWNPSSDVTSPNHAFHEHGHELLSELVKQHDVYIIIHVNNEEQKEHMEHLLENANINQLDPRKVLFCSTEEGKIHLVRHLEPQIHIEGGWEEDDGEDIIRKLRPFIPKLIWVITKRRRSSFNTSKKQQQSLKPEDQGILGPNVELTDHLLDTSFAKELGFVLD
ncbi:hypothetical protein BJ944DRAFT_268521 [Cunninghamella echinulata]|nr:hypothetical protein BJ944DRAFT_268521 [Cunninghamella echinulata]